MMWSTEYVKSANKTKTQKYKILHTLWFIFCAFWPLLLFRFNYSWGLHLTRRGTAAKTSNFKQEGKHNRMKRAQNNLKDERSKTKTTDERIHLTELFLQCRAALALKNAIWTLKTHSQSTTKYWNTNKNVTKTTGDGIQWVRKGKKWEHFIILYLF